MTFDKLPIDSLFSWHVPPTAPPAIAKKVTPTMYVYLDDNKLHEAVDVNGLPSEHEVWPISQRYRVAFEVDAKNEGEALDTRPEEGFNPRAYAIGEKPEDYDVPNGKKVLVRLPDGRYAMAKITGWCVDKPMYANAQHINFPGEKVMLASAEQIFDPL